MRQYAPQTNDMGSVPSGMDHDPNADEEVINQQQGEQLPSRLPKPDVATPADDLASALAYAIDGSGPGPTGNEPQAPERKVITEGITGASLRDEEDNLRNT